MNKFGYVGVLLDMLYGIELEEEEIEEIGLLGWNLIGNKNVKLYKYSTCINPKDNSITLPCNAFYQGGAEGGVVEAVTSNHEDWQVSTNKHEFGDFESSMIEQNIEHSKYYTDPLYISGTYLKYEQVGDKLYFPHNYGSVNILYKGILSDEDGLPELTDKEANAIATYIAYVTKYKEGLITNNTVTINLATNLYNTWLKQCDQARVKYLNQNDMNNILNAKSSWNRHFYSKSLKPVS